MKWKTLASRTGTDFRLRMVSGVDVEVRPTDGRSLTAEIIQASKDSGRVIEKGARYVRLSWVDTRDGETVRLWIWNEEEVEAWTLV